MVWSAACKLLQRQTYSILSHRYGFLLVVFGLVMVIVSALQFGEVALEWSKEKYAAVFNSFSDNVAGRSFQNRLCLPVPIDVVYTWVNGTDPRLLADLRKFKMQLETEINATRIGNQASGNGSPTCSFANCVPSTQLVVFPALSEMLTLPNLALLYPALMPALSMGNFKVTGGTASENITVFTFNTTAEVQAAQKMPLLINGRNATTLHGYWTSDWTLPDSILLPDTIIMSGFPHTLTAEEIQQKLPKRINNAISKFMLYPDQGVAVLVIPEKAEFDYALANSNFTIDGKEPALSAANLLWNLQDSTYIEEISANRFEDNEELRYSLRSIERFAPWVRHVYIVTNGQIPSWLNLDCPRLTIISHDEIFPNKSHLPTFSSPSIESHLHRIPGLSDKFIYLNDDVMFGKEVWPDDFYTHAHGQKVYLTWPVPNCQDGCPSSWIRDGYCDKACNNSACEWDGGDCDGSNKNVYHGAAAGIPGFQVQPNYYCNSGCANNWIADRYCDPSCNVKVCGFDAGDCGVSKFNQLHEVKLDPEVHFYTVPTGETVAFFNLTAVFDSGSTLEEGMLEEDSAVRSATLAQKFKVMTLVLYENSNKTMLNFTLKGKDSNETKIEFCFNVSVNAQGLNKSKSLGENETKLQEDLKVEDGTHNKSTTENKTTPAFVFEDIPEDEQNPVAIYKSSSQISNVNMSLYELPEDIFQLLEDLLTQLQEGDLTEKGFLHHQSELWQTYMSRLESEGRKPVLRPITVPPKPPSSDRNGTNDLTFDKTGPLKVINNSVGIQNNIYMKQNVMENKGILNALKPQVADDGVGFNAYLQSKQGKDKFSNHRLDDRQKEDVGNEKMGPRNEDNLQQNMFNNQQLKPANESILNAEKHIRNFSKAAVKNKIPLKGRTKETNLGNKELNQPSFDVQTNLKNEALQEKMKINLDVQAKDKVELDARKFDSNIRDPNDSIAATHFNSRKLQQIEVGDEELGFLPWEKQGVFAELQKKKDALLRQQYYQTGRFLHRQTLDTFADSLRHVNRLFNKEFGYMARKVPAHMPHMVDRHIMAELQERFLEEWDATSSHRIRSSTDMQFAFSYFYYLMEEPQKHKVEDFFNDMDVDHSGVLSDREIRTMATRLYDLPLDLQTLTGLEKMLVNCSNHLESDPDLINSNSQPEVYYDKEMPQVTRFLVVNCGPVTELIQKHIKAFKYKHEVVGDEEVAFKMVRTNVSHVVGQLDDIRKNPKKFVCLNDNIDHTKEDAKTVKAVIADFYESLFPLPSIFELPREYRNRFLHVDELREWRKYRDWLKLWTHAALFVLIVFSLASFFADKLDTLRRKIFGRRVLADADGVGNGNVASAPNADSRIQDKPLLETV